VADAGEPKPEPPSLEDLYREIDRLRRELEKSEQARERLKRENERLKKELAAVRRAGKRQAAPFSKGAPNRILGPPAVGPVAATVATITVGRQRPSMRSLMCRFRMNARIVGVASPKRAWQPKKTCRSCGRTCAVSTCMLAAVVDVAVASKAGIRCRQPMRSVRRARMWAARCRADRPAQ
jgi:hypothetical protein